MATGLPVDLLELIVLTLAAARLTRFFILDSLMGFGIDSHTGQFVSPLAEKIDRFAYTQGEIDDTGRVIEQGGTDRSFLRGKIGDLLTCIFCLGFWISAACYFAFLGATIGWDGIIDIPLAVHGVTVFAVAGGQAYFNSRDGW